MRSEIWTKWRVIDEADGTKTYEHVEESLAMLRRTLQEQGPFVGVLGFSQGKLRCLRSEVCSAEKMCRRSYGSDADVAFAQTACQPGV